MIKIAVCDDEEVMCEQLKQMVASRLKQQEETFQITCYTNAIQFLHTPLDFDLIFLDIQMPGKTGMEIARQLRLRNLSGIIIVDFINLTEHAAREILLTRFREALRNDPIPTQLVDMTKLGLVELTRKKGKRTLMEAFGS